MTEGGSSPQRLLSCVAIATIRYQISSFEHEEGEATSLANNLFKCEYAGELIRRYPADFPLHELWRFCQPQGWKVYSEVFVPTFVPFVLTDAEGNKTFGLSVTIAEKTSLAVVRAAVLEEPNNSRFVLEELQADRPVYVPKAILVVCGRPLFGIMRRCLCGLVVESMNTGAGTRWPAILAGELPLPSPRALGIEFTLGGLVVQVASSPPNDFPIVDMPLATLFQLLSISTVLSLLSCILLERKIIFLSSQYSHLTMVAESLRTLLFPFDVPTIYIPILPQSLLQFIDVPTPFIFGIHHSFQPPHLDSLTDILVVDIDKDHLLHTDLIEPLPEPYKSQFHQELRHCLLPDVMNEDTQLTSSTTAAPATYKSASNRDIQQVFFSFFVRLLARVSDYVLFLKLFPQPIVHFEKIRYLQENPSSFMSTLVTTSVFDNFIRAYSTGINQSLFMRAVRELPQAPSFTIRTPLPPRPSLVKLNLNASTSSEKDYIKVFEDAKNGLITIPLWDINDNKLVPMRDIQGVIADQSEKAIEDVMIPVRRSLMDEDMAEAAETDAQVEAQENLGLFIRRLFTDIASGKQPHCALHDLDRVFVRKTARALFAVEFVRFCEGSKTMQSLDEIQFTWLAQLTEKVLSLSFRESDIRPFRLMIPKLALVSRANTTELILLCHYLQDLFEEGVLWSNIGLWEEALFGSIDLQRRTAYHPILVDYFKAVGRSPSIKDALAQFPLESTEKQKQLLAEEDELIFSQIKIFVSTMIALGLDYDEARIFAVDNIAILTKLTEESNEQLIAYIDGVIRTNEDRMVKKALSNKTLKVTLHGVTLEDNSSVADWLLPAETLLLQSDKITYVSSLLEVAEGNVYLTNYRVMFKGVFVRSHMQERHKNKVTIDMPLGSIIEIERTDIRSLHNSLWVPAGVVLKSSHFNVVTFCMDEENEVNPRTFSQAIQRANSPRKGQKFAHLYDGSDIFNNINRQLAPSFNTCWGRPQAFHSSMEAIDRIMLDSEYSSENPLPNWKIFNGNWHVCTSYPMRVLAPAGMTIDDITQLAKFYNKKRFPVATWFHPDHGRALLRSALTKSPRGASNQRIKIDEKLLQLLVNEKIYVVTERDTSNVEFFNRSYDKNLDFYYSGVNFAYVKNSSKQRFSVDGIQLRFIKFLNTCTSGDPDQDDWFFSTIAENWLYAIEDIFGMAMLVVNLMETHEAHILVALEDGWDRTLQVTALAQVLMDPFYRTIYGFQVLVEKEWVRAGHQFPYRCGSSESRKDERAPIFLQFIDCVWQLLRQFPNEFEFNEFYLRTIAYEAYNNRFGTFIYLSEMDRVHEEGTQLRPVSLWEYLNARHVRTPDFYNFEYHPPFSQVLHPQTCSASFELWEQHYLIHYYSNLVQKGYGFNSLNIASLESDALSTPIISLLMDVGVHREQKRLKAEPLTAKYVKYDDVPPWLQLWKEIAGVDDLAYNQTIHKPKHSVSSPITPTMLDHVDDVFAGYLLKQGGKIRSWKQRWFVINFREKFCIYYESKENLVEKGHIAFADISDVRLSSNLTDDSYFEVVTKKRVYLLKTANTGKLTEWMDAFKKFSSLAPPSPITRIGEDRDRSSSPPPLSGWSILDGARNLVQKRKSHLSKEVQWEK